MDDSEISKPDSIRFDFLKISILNYMYERFYSLHQCRLETNRCTYATASRRAPNHPTASHQTSVVGLVCTAADRHSIMLLQSLVFRT